MAIQDEHTPLLMRIPGVVGTATGLNANGQLAVKVYLDRPGVAGLPATLQGVPVELEVTGMFVARLDSSTADRWTRPVPIGVSTGHPNITAGTIGCRVVDDDGNLFALSNNHVLANSNAASIGDPEVLNDGDPALQPGPYDGGTSPADQIGWLFDFVPIAFDGSWNYVDAAIAYVTASDLGTSTPTGIGYGAPGTSVADAAVGMAVQKVGRTTSWTYGQVDAINVVVDVCYETRGPFRCVKLARFANQFTITPGTFSAGGDSGSLIVTHDEHKQPVGLLFAGSSTHTIANPIQAVLDAFGVEIDNGTVRPGNQRPTVTIDSPEDGDTFAYGTTITFTGTADDPEDGNLSPHIVWTSSIDGWLETGGSITTELSPGSHTVTASVTDSGGLTGSDSITVTVLAPPSSGIVLNATGYKVRGRQTVDLSWDGATTSHVYIYRNGALITTTPNDGAHTDSIGAVGGGSYTYRLCETGESGVCSNEVTVTF